MARHPGINPILVHIGQRYDESVSGLFFTEMSLPPGTSPLTPILTPLTEDPHFLTLLAPCRRG
jgi:hypothetical protein